MIAMAIKSEGGSGGSSSRSLYYCCLQPCSKKHAQYRTPLLLHAALLADHSAHYAQWEQERFACLVALVLDRDQRERKRAIG